MNNVVKKFKKGNRIQQNKSSGIRKMQTAAGGPIDYKKWDNRKITSYTIPYIKEKAVKLTNAGKATGAKLSTNLLDSIADNAYRAKLPIRKALGIAFKESTFGNPTDDKSAWNSSSKIRKQFNGKYPGIYQHINNGRTVLGQHLINYHKGDVNHEVFYEGNPDAHKSIIQEAFEFYKQHPDKYNPGQKNYQKLINKRGDEAMQSPEIQKWYKDWEKSKIKILKPEPYKINTSIQDTIQKFIPYSKQGGKILKGQNGLTAKMKEAKKARDFVVSYYNSPGFRERFHKLEKRILNEYNNSSYNPDKLGNYTKTRILKYPLKLKTIRGNDSIANNAYYNRDTHNIDIGNFSKSSLEKFGGYSGVTAHELAHAIDNSLILQARDSFFDDMPELQNEYSKFHNAILGKYSGIYPIFRKSKSYVKFRNSLSDNSKRAYDVNPSFEYESNHNGDPGESYADLMTLRNALNKAGVFDSREAGQEFKQEHLNKFRSIDNTQYRLFDNFSDDEVIWMMNNVAQNNNILKDNDYISYAEQGGKMNILEFLKKGSGIHIKKKNRGKFTSYCGGKVTDECIRKAKASGNPTLVKRATFAANARKWKHKDGGVFKAADGTKLQKLGNTLNNSGLGEFLINGLASYKQNRAQNNYIDNYEQMQDASIEMERTQANKQNWKEALQLSNQFQQDNYDPENPNKFGGVFAQVIPYQIYNMLNYQTDQDFRNKKVQLKSQTQALKDQNTTNFITNLGGQAISFLGNIASNKKQATSV